MGLRSSRKAWKVRDGVPSAVVRKTPNENFGSARIEDVKARLKTNGQGREKGEVRGGGRNG